MIYHRRPSWRLPERAATDERVFWNRRAFILAGAGATALWTAGCSDDGERRERATAPSETDRAGRPFEPTPARNPSYADAGRPVTDEATNSTYNNFYEFGSSKDIWEKAQALRTDDWTLIIDGMVRNPIEISVGDLLTRVSVEERVVRHRCVEAWSMAIPWIGFPVSALSSVVEPLGAARYVRFESFEDSDIAPGQRSFFYPWPYVEGLTVEEAANELAFLAVGAYGKFLPKQFGAPIRLHAPWKYGFKSGKSVRRISFVSERPVSFWEDLASSEYGFWANVNPDVPHPRWSQASERVLGSGERVPTQLYNGYGEQVAQLYSAMDIGAALYR